MLKLNPYLNFEGNCEEAMNFYKNAIGTEFLGQGIMRFGDAPGGDQFPENERNLVMHSAFMIGNDILMASDVPSFAPVKFNQGNNTSLSLSPDSLKESEKLFKALSEGGTIIAPFVKHFFGYHGSIVDKFGVKWLVTFEEK